MLWQDFIYCRFFIYLLVYVAILDLRLSQFFSFFLFPAHICFSVWWPIVSAASVSLTWNGYDQFTVKSCRWHELNICGKIMQGTFRQVLDLAWFSSVAIVCSLHGWSAQSLGWVPHAFLDPRPRWPHPVGNLQAVGLHFFRWLASPQPLLVMVVTVVEVVVVFRKSFSSRMRVLVSTVLGVALCLFHEKPSSNSLMAVSVVDVCRLCNRRPGIQHQHAPC